MNLEEENVSDEENLNFILRNLETIYEPTDYEEFNQNFGYKSNKIKKTIYSFIEKEDFESIDSFTNGFLVYPMSYFETIFASIQYYAAKSFIKRVEELTFIVEEALDDFDKDDIQDYLWKSHKELNDRKNELSEFEELCESIRGKMRKDEDYINAVKEKAIRTWIEHDEYESATIIKEFISQYLYCCLHYQTCDVNSAIAYLFEKYYLITKDTPNDEGLDKLYHRAWACVASIILLEDLFLGKQISDELHLQIDENIQSLKKMALDGMNLRNSLIEKQNEIDRINEENERTKEKIKEMQNQIAEINREKELHKIKEKSPSKIKSFLNFLNTINHVETDSNRLDIDSELLAIGNLMSRIESARSRSFSFKVYPQDINKLNMEKAKIRAKINKLTPEQLKTFKIGWNTTVSTYTEISFGEAQMYPMNAIQAVLDWS